jgi:DNA-binding transcriptional LysR family regulator
MDIEQLRAFDRVEREGSFSRAAWTLRLAQPTVSMRIQALERTIGGPLFVRGGRGVALTDLGASFLPFARRALEVLDAGIDAARQAQAGERGRVAVGVLESLSGSFLGPALASFHAARPKVELLVRAGRHEQLMELLLDGVVSLAIIAWPCPETQSAELEQLLKLRERVVLVVGPDHVLSGGGSVDEVRVAKEAQPFLLMRWWLSLPAPVARIAQLAATTIDLPMDTGRQMVLSGSGAGFFPWMQVAEPLAAGRLRAIAVEGMPPVTRESALVRRAATKLTPAAEALAAEIGVRARRLRLTS